MARQPSSASTASRSPGSQLWQVDTGAVLPHRRLDRYPTRPAAPPGPSAALLRWGRLVPAGRRAGRGSGPQRPGTGPLASSQAVRRPLDRFELGSRSRGGAGSVRELGRGHPGQRGGRSGLVGRSRLRTQHPSQTSADRRPPRRQPPQRTLIPHASDSCASGWLVVPSPTSRSLRPTGRPGRQSDAATGQVRPSAALPAARGPTQRPGRGPVAASSAGARGRRDAAS